MKLALAALAFAVPIASDVTPGTLKPVPWSCTNSVIEDSVARMLTSTVKLQVFRTTDRRANPDLGKSLSGLDMLTSDNTRQCVANVLTDHGEFRIVYGWKPIDNGQIYITTRVLPLDDP